jgi:hypothetical protein
MGKTSCEFSDKASSDMPCIALGGQNKLAAYRENHITYRLLALELAKLGDRLTTFYGKLNYLKTDFLVIEINLENNFNYITLGSIVIFRGSTHERYWSSDRIAKSFNGLRSVIRCKRWN